MVLDKSQEAQGARTPCKAHLTLTPSVVTLTGPDTRYSSSVSVGPKTDIAKSAFAQQHHMQASNIVLECLDFLKVELYFFLLYPIMTD